MWAVQSHDGRGRVGITMVYIENCHDCDFNRRIGKGRLPCAKHRLEDLERKLEEAEASLRLALAALSHYACRDHYDPTFTLTGRRKAWALTDRGRRARAILRAIRGSDDHGKSE